MPADYFLQISGVEGESADAKHKGWIDVASWAWGETQSGSSGSGGGGGAGKVQMQDLHVVARMSKASPKLFLACATGQHFKEARLAGRRTGRAQQDFLLWSFADVLVTSYQTAGTEGDDVPTDQVSLGFARIKVELRTEKADGSLGEVVTAGWDVKANKQL